MTRPTERYCQRILDLLAMEKCKPVVTPFAGKYVKFVGEAALAPATLKLYRQVAGKFMWLVLERPDLMYTVKELCRKLSNATDADFAVLKRAVRFLAHTRDFILRMEIDERV